MPAENREVLDDFLLDMDIETITIDDMQPVELPASASGPMSADLSAGDLASSQVMGDLKMDNVTIEEINLGAPAAGGAPSALSGDDGTPRSVTINIGQATIQGDLKGDVQGPVYTSGATVTAEAPAAAPQEVKTNRPVEKKADIHEIEMETLPLPDDETISIDLGAMESLAATATPAPVEPDFLQQGIESDITLGELNKIEEIPEPSMPVLSDSDDIPFEAPQTDAAELVTQPEPEPVPVRQDRPVRQPEKPADVKPETPEVQFSSEDDIIFIDGSELDKMIYGSRASAAVGNISVIEEQEPPIISEPEAPESHEMLITAADLNVREKVPVAEEIITEEIPVSSLDVPPLDEGIIRDNDPAIEETGITVPPAADQAALPEFNIDLSVIPDVEPVEEDEPIALSLDELNNIDISDDQQGFIVETAENRPPAPEDDEKIEISLDELNEIQKDISPERGREERARLIEQQLEGMSIQSREDLRAVLAYLDTLLEELPEDKIREFAKSEYYDLYVKILEKLGI